MSCTYMHGLRVDISLDFEADEICNVVAANEMLHAQFQSQENKQTKGGSATVVLLFWPGRQVAQGDKVSCFASGIGWGGPT
jgi:hypothetical protein